MKKHNSIIVLLAISIILGVATTFKDPAFTIGGSINNILASMVLLFVGYFIFNKIRKKTHKQTINAENLPFYDYFVAGTEYCEDNLSKLARVNADYHKDAQTLADEGKLEKPVYEYKYKNSPAELIFEPDNKYDSNAIRVQIAGLKVGYIPMSENVEVKKILSTANIEKISAFIGGGKYKIVSPDLSVNGDKKDIFVKVTIKSNAK